MNCRVLIKNKFLNKFAYVIPGDNIMWTMLQMILINVYIRERYGPDIECIDKTTHLLTRWTLIFLLTQIQLHFKSPFFMMSQRILEKVKGKFVSSLNNICENCKIVNKHLDFRLFRSIDIRNLNSVH